VKTYFEDAAVPQIHLTTKPVQVQRGLHPNRMGTAASSKKRKISRSGCSYGQRNWPGRNVWRRINQTELNWLFKFIYNIEINGDALQ
jgi:hypothetical protein